MGVVWVAIEVVLLLAREMEVVWVSGVVWVDWVMEADLEVVFLAGEMDLVAGLDFLAGAGAKQNDGKTTRDISGGTLHLKSIRAGMLFGEGEAGRGDDGLLIIPLS